MRGIREGDLERSWRPLQAIDALADGMIMRDVLQELPCSETAVMKRFPKMNQNVRVHDGW